MNILGYRTTSHCHHFAFINLDPIDSDYIPQKSDLKYGKGALFWVAIEFLPLQDVHDLLEMVHVFLLSSVIDECVIKIYNHKSTYIKGPNT